MLHIYEANKRPPVSDYERKRNEQAILDAQKVREGREARLKKRDFDAHNKDSGFEKHATPVK